MILAHHHDPDRQSPGALDGVAAKADQDLLGGSGSDQLRRRLSQGRRRTGRGPGTGEVPENSHGMETAGHLDDEGGTVDLVSGTVGAAQGTGKRGCRIAELPGKVTQHGRVVPGREAAQEVPASQLLDRVTQHLTGRRVGVDVAPPSIDNADPVLGPGQHLGQRRQA